MSGNETTFKLGRLTRRPEFLYVRDGAYAARKYIVVQARENPALEGEAPAPIRVGFTATKRIGAAVVRNRCKRRMRELARALLPRLGKAGFDYVFIAREGLAEAEFSALQAEAQKALEKLAR